MSGEIPSLAVPAVLVPHYKFVIEGIVDYVRAEFNAREASVFREGDAYKFERDEIGRVVDQHGMVCSVDTGVRKLGGRGVEATGSTPCTTWATVYPCTSSPVLLNE